MKKLLSVVVVFVLLVAMSVSAFAAAPTTAQDEATGSWTTSGSDEAYANSMMTILAYTEGQAISVDSIQYIDQTTADENGAYEFANYLPKVDPTGATKYVVLVGGQNVVDGPLAAGYIEAKVEENNLTITGTITKTGNNTAAVVALLSGEEVVATVNADATTGEFSITAPAGTYTLKITKPGHSSYYYNNIDVTEVDAVLYPGNVNGDAFIDVSDITPLVLNLGSAKTADNAGCDVTDDTYIDVSDITPLILNLGNADTVLPAVAE